MMLEQIRQRLLAIPTTPPDALAGFELREGLDSTDDPAVWVYVIVRDEKIEALWADWDQLRQRIRDAVSEVTGDRVNCYVRMWAESEQTVRPVAAHSVSSPASTTGSQTRQFSPHCSTN